MLSRRPWRWLSALLTLAMVSPPASAQPAPPRAASGQPAADPQPASQPDPARAEAEARFEEGSEAYNLGRFALAIEHFEAAYELTQANPLLYNIAQASAKLFDVDPDPAHLRKAKIMFLNFAKIAEATQADPRDARARVQQIDDRLADLAAEQAQIRAKAEQAEAARLAAKQAEVERIAAETRRLDAETRAELARRYRPSPLGIAGYSLLSVGLIGGTTLLIIGGVSISRLDDQQAAESALPLTADRIARYDQHRDQAGLLATTGSLIGLGMLLAGVTMVTVDRVRRRRALRRASLGPGGLRLAF